MSGQWEVVGKKKDKANKNPAKNNDKNQRIKNNFTDLKLEDVLPQSQIKNLFNAERNKENKKPQEKSKNQENKKPNKKQEKPQEAPKPKPPKSIESALNSIDVEEFKNIYEQSKQHFPEAPIVWLKELSQYLNLKVPIDIQDVVFSTKPDGYPLNVAPAPVRNVIERAVKDSGKSNAQLFFDISLTSMATDMSKGLPALGHKFLLQYIASVDTTVATNSINKHIVLRNSYQNRPNIGSSILWAVGQAGFKDLTIGLKVFQDLMLPLIELKNYSRFVVLYLQKLLNYHKNASLTKEQYLMILDTVFSGKKNFPMDLKQELINTVPSLKSLLFSKSDREKCRTYVESFVKRLNTYSNKSYQDSLCDIIVECFIRDDTSFSTWSVLYTKNLPSSAILINYIGDNWQSLSNRLHVKTFSALLNTYKVTNEQLLTKKRKDEGIHDVVAALKKMSEKMSKEKKSGFSLKTILFLLTLGLAAFVYNDINQHGSWKDSITSKALKDSGIHEYTNKALNRTKEGLLWMDSQVELHFPGIHENVAGFSAPYLQLVGDLGNVGYNLCLNMKKSVIEKYPCVIKTIDSYAPGLIDTTQKTAVSVWTTTTGYVNSGIEYLRKEVFVGQLSPENMQKVVVETFKTAEQKTVDCYHWIYEKVQTTIK